MHQYEYLGWSTLLSLQWRIVVYGAVSIQEASKHWNDASHMSQANVSFGVKCKTSTESMPPGRHHFLRPSGRSQAKNKKLGFTGLIFTYIFNTMLGQPHTPHCFSASIKQHTILSLSHDWIDPTWPTHHIPFLKHKPNRYKHLLLISGQLYLLNWYWYAE